MIILCYQGLRQAGRVSSFGQTVQRLDLGTSLFASLKFLRPSLAFLRLLLSRSGAAWFDARGSVEQGKEGGVGIQGAGSLRDFLKRSQATDVFGSWVTMEKGWIRGSGRVPSGSEILWWDTPADTLSVGSFSSFKAFIHLALSCPSANQIGKKIKPKTGDVSW